MKNLRFIHMADLHLDSPFAGLKKIPERLFAEIKEASNRSLARGVDAAIREAVDFVLIAGDIYDKEDLSIRAQVVFYQEMKRLEQADIPVYLIHGNHDFYAEGQDRLQLPENVTVFPPHVKTVLFQRANRPTASIYGFSYDRRHIPEKRIQEYQRTGEADFHIGLLHGSEITQSEAHDVYAPFSVNELKSKRFDYWALGHIHKRMTLDLEPMIHYPGNMQGRSRKELGPKGCTFVTLDEGGSTATFIPTSPLIWEDVIIQFDEVPDKTQLFKRLTDCLAHYKELPESYFLQLHIEMPHNDKLLREDWLSMLQEQALAEDGTFVWVNQLFFSENHDEVAEDWWKNGLLQEEWQFAKDKLDAEGPFFQNIEALYFHSGMSRFMEDISESERQEITTKAMKRVGSLLADLEGEKK
ncbi:metallophosphoesterase family protein [Listeria ilorinensis]|uniref:metallophosphoesterase family protein n=1 Tax=Listeria ilorinensis TaxID=2867439 RepID=UPI001EF68181|nr:exonuclease SbcCD subunit D [Listeria ilorinensis]